MSFQHFCANSGKIKIMLSMQTRIHFVILLGYLLPLLASAQPPQNPVAYPHDQTLYDTYPHAILYYYGLTVSDPLVRMFEEMHRWPEHIQSIEYTYTLNKANPVRVFFCPLVGVTQLALNVTERRGSRESTIYEVAPYIAWRWANLPWNDYVTTSFAIGEGVSYATSYPSLEKKSNVNTKRLLNYLMLEATFASPCYPRLQMVMRIHHRSGAFGLYRAGNTGSNVIGLGVRYLFA